MCRATDLVQTALAAHTKLANSLYNRGEYAKALPARRQVVALAERLAARDPKNLWRRRDLLFSRKNLADSFVTTGQIEEGRAEYESVLAAAKQLSADAPQDDTTQRLVVHVYDALGDAHSDVPREALVHYRAGFALAAERAAKNAGNAELETLAEYMQAKVRKYERASARRRPR